MKKILSLTLIFLILFSFCSCSESSSTFSIHFIDVGQGDSALIQCDGHYMLIDGGDIQAAEKVRDVLEKAFEIRGTKKLDILAISHLHEDHYGGLIDALKSVYKIDLTISNSDNNNKISSFIDFKNELHRVKGNGSKITIPQKGKEYKLGSAIVKVLDTYEKDENDSLVLLITYKNKSFLFTGDSEKQGQQRIVDELKKINIEKNSINLIKMPHHGAYNDKLGFQDNELNSLFRVYQPTYFIISVGKNSYNHPHPETLKILKDYVETAKKWSWNRHVYRTDMNGDIMVVSKGEKLKIISKKGDFREIYKSLYDK